MKQISIFIALCFLAAACHKKPSAVAEQGQASDAALPAGNTSDQPQVQPTSNKPLPPPPPPVAANADNYLRAGVNGQADQFLTTQLHIFINQTGRLPQSFAEFASRRLDSMPVPPPGTKWVIDSSDSSVKSAPAK